ncbi:MAG: alpha-1,2-mannosyltransferase [Paracoccaceae bacterium]
MSTITWRDVLISGILAISVLAISISVFANSPSADLMAVYLAGQQYAAGNFDQIYPASADTFNLAVPASWRQLAVAHGLGDMQLFPYIYPPLWAALAGKLAGLAHPSTIFAISHFVNPVLLFGTIFLSWRAFRPTSSLPLWMLIGVLAVFPTVYGFIALHQSQPQILVSFLIVLAIERSRSNRPLSAGMALALAASIKLYPVLFVVIWIGSGERRAIKSFVVSGAILAAASLMFGGTDLHLNFLSQIATINDTVLLTQLSFNFDSLLAQFFLSDLYSPNAQAAPHLTSATGVNLLKPQGFGLASKAFLILSLVFIYWRAAKSTDSDIYTRLWPAMIILVSLFGPLSWAYHYIGAAVFFPALIVTGPRKMSFWATAIVLIVLSIPGIKFLSLIEMDFYLVQAVGTLGTGLIAALFLWPARKS